MNTFYLLNFCTDSKDIPKFLDLSYLRDFQNQTALQNGIASSQIISKTYQDLLPTDFYKNNNSILSQPRGAGYWLWKPYFIYETLKQLSEGDFLMYLDSKRYFVSSPFPLLEVCKKNNGFFLIEDNYSNRLIKQWTKLDCLISLDANNETIKNQQMCDAAMQIYQKNTQTMEFVAELLQKSTLNGIITDIPSKLGKEDSAFIEHRHDQSILSILKNQHKIEGFRRPVLRKNYLKYIYYYLNPPINRKNYYLNFFYDVITPNFELNKSLEEQRIDYTLLSSIKSKLKL